MAMRPRLVRGENIGQTLQFVASGNVTAGLIAESQRRHSGAAGLNCRPVPQELYSPILQQAVIINDTAISRDFIAYLKTPVAQHRIRQAGYDLP